MIKVISDGTPSGTRVIDENGNEIKDILSLKIEITVDRGAVAYLEFACEVEVSAAPCVEGFNIAHIDSRSEALKEILLRELAEQYSINPVFKP